jgi:hypothetical protein
MWGEKEKKEENNDNFTPLFVFRFQFMDVRTNEREIERGDFFDFVD